MAAAQAACFAVWAWAWGSVVVDDVVSEVVVGCCSDEDGAVASPVAASIAPAETKREDMLGFCGVGWVIRVMMLADGLAPLRKGGCMWRG